MPHVAMCAMLRTGLRITPEPHSLLTSQRRDHYNMFLCIEMCASRRKRARGPPEGKSCQEPGNANAKEGKGRRLWLWNLPVEHMWTHMLNGNHTPPHPTKPHHTPPHPPHPTTPHHTPPHPTTPHHTQPHPTTPNHTQPHPTTPSCTRPHPPTPPKVGG